jgi:hypothetical protein
MQAPVPAPCSPPGLVYEVEFTPLEGALEEHAFTRYLQRVVDLPAIAGGRLYRACAGGYVAQFSLLDAEQFEREAVPVITREHAALQTAWGESLQIRSRLLQGAEEHSAARAERCLNCNAIVTGQYCWHCGQRARVRMITLGELLRGLTTDLVQFESRLWRSLHPLLLRPGALTAEYLAGRRVRYMPPFRMYLVLSLLFFLLVTLGFGGATVQLGASEGEITAVLSGETAAPGPAAVTASERRDLAERSCNVEGLPAAGIPVLGFLLTRDLIEDRCRRIVMEPQRYLNQFVDALPVSLLLLLPLLAAVMKGLYLFTGRYYVEHLLFFVHYHAFLFLFVMLLTLALRLVGSAPLPGAIGGLLALSAWLYALYYPYRAMRRIYGQGRGITLFKFGLLLLAYGVFLLIMILATLAITALRA